MKLGGGGMVGLILQPTVVSVVPMSLVLASASSQYLSLTWGNSPTDSTRTTIAFWTKLASGVYTFYDGGQWTGGAQATFAMNNFDQLTTFVNSAGNFVSSGAITISDSVWHHICAQKDSNQATGTNRTHLYVDGVEVAYVTQTPPSAGANWHDTDSGITSAIGRQQNATNYLNGKLAYFYFIDGQALSPSSFITGTGSGTCHPATYSGAFGTNGFFLDFRSSATLDQSGNHNDWSQNGGPTFSSDLPT